MPPLPPVIGSKNQASWPLRHAGIPFEEVRIRPFRPESPAARSPSGKVPAPHDGDLRVWDSLAICEYLNECFPDEQLSAAAAAGKRKQAPAATPFTRL